MAHADVMRAYRENPDFAPTEVEPLLDDLQDKTVVTADHGELLGDRERPIPTKIYCHPEGVYVDGLVKVPWYVYHKWQYSKTGQPMYVGDESRVGGPVHTDGVTVGGESEIRKFTVERTGTSIGDVEPIYNIYTSEEAVFTFRVDGTAE